MKTYLVTGGAGFIGSNFVIYMLNKYKPEERGKQPELCLCSGGYL